MFTEEEVEFAWNVVLWCAGILNVLALIPQPLIIIQKKTSAGVAWQTYVLFAFLQAVFAIEFWRYETWSQVISMILSFMLSITTLVLIVLYKKDRDHEHD